MDWLEALILGLIQGLTEFLPVSSSGHLILGEQILGVETSESLAFTVAVHGATVLSTIIIFRHDILLLFKGLFAFRNNDETRYVAKILFSMIPVLIIGLFLESTIESFFEGNVLFVGFMLWLTALLLAFTFWAKQSKKKISFGNAFVIGIAQAIAVLPGISRSGATIATGLLLKNDKEQTARFSFLMVLIPIIGANAKKTLDGGFSAQNIETLPLIVGVVAAFVSGLLACRLMLRIVKQSKLIYFALYCFIVGTIAVVYAGFFA